MLHLTPIPWVSWVQNNTNVYHVQRSGQQRFLCSLDTAQPLVQTSTQRRPQSEPRAHMLTRVLAFLRRRVVVSRVTRDLLVTAVVSRDVTFCVRAEPVRDQNLSPT